MSSLVLSLTGEFTRRELQRRSHHNSDELRYSPCAAAFLPPSKVVFASKTPRNAPQPSRKHEQ